MIEPRTPGPNARPVAYIRRSISRVGDAGDVSREFQTEEVRRLAGDDGSRLVVIDQDWGVSAAREKTHRRLAFLAMLASIERGEVSTVYAYSTDRLARSVRWAAQLLDACEDAGAAVVTREGRFAPGDSAARMTFSVLAMANENAVRGMSDKARSTARVRDDRGDAMGALPYGYRRARAGEAGMTTEEHPDPQRIVLVPDPAEPLAPILDAWERSGHSPRRAARILNDEAHIPTKHGGVWDRKSILRLIAREAPGRLPMPAPSGRRGDPPTPALFAKLLACHCGRTMTPNRHVEKRRANVTESVSYYCARGHVERSSHPRVYVAESIILEWAKREAARLEIPAERVTDEADDAAVRENLRAKRERWIDQYGEGLIDRAKRDAKLAEIDAALARLTARSVSHDLPPEPIDWTWPTERLSSVLRALWRRIELGPDLRPIRSEWVVPEWRSEP